MEFLVEFEVEVPAGTPDAEVEQRGRAESAAAAKLAEDGHLIRLWRRPLLGDGTTAIGKRSPTMKTIRIVKTIKRPPTTPVEEPPTDWRGRPMPY